MLTVTPPAIGCDETDIFPEPSNDNILLALVVGIVNVGDVSSPSNKLILLVIWSLLSLNIATALSNSVFNAVISNVPLTGKSVVLSIVIRLTTTTLSSAVSPEPNVIVAPVPNSYALSLEELLAVTL